MFESTPVEDLVTAVPAVVHDFDEDNGASRIDAVVAWDRLIRFAQAQQLKEIHGLYADRTAYFAALAAGDPALQVIGQVSLARNISPGAAGSQFGIALALSNLPKVASALSEGVISEPTVRAICKASAGLAIEDLAIFDVEIAPHLPGLTPRRAGQLAERIAISLDPESAAERAQRRRDDVRVDFTPQRDGMATLSVDGPAEEVAAAHRALQDNALSLAAEGDDRPIQTLMFATLVERLTGATQASDLTVEVDIVIDLATLMGTAQHPVELVGYGPISPTIADEIMGRAHRVFYRRLLTDPITQTLLARDERRRLFDRGLAGFIRSRDRHRCRQPGCDCRIRDIDHVQAYANGGKTTTDNGQGVCKTSHVIKHLPGWSVTTNVDGSITWRTPTGHTYLSRAPSLHPLAA